MLNETYQDDRNWKIVSSCVDEEASVREAWQIPNGGPIDFIPPLCLMLFVVFLVMLFVLLVVSLLVLVFVLLLVLLKLIIILLLLLVFFLWNAFYNGLCWESWTWAAQVLDMQFCCRGRKFRILAVST